MRGLLREHVIGSELNLEVSRLGFGDEEELVQGVGNDATHSFTPTGDLGLIFTVFSIFSTLSSFPLAFMFGPKAYEEKRKCYSQY